LTDRMTNLILDDLLTAAPRWCQRSRGGVSGAAGRGDAGLGLPCGLRSKPDRLLVVLCQVGAWAALLDVGSAALLDATSPAVGTARDYRERRSPTLAECVHPGRPSVDTIGPPA
jgi:hypothetical protein